MSRLTNQNPIRDLINMQQALDQVWRNEFMNAFNANLANPAVDLIEREDSFVVRAELPGFSPENVDIQIEGNVLHMRGQINQSNEENGQYHLRERQMVSFYRSVTLPRAVNSEGAEAVFENGVLTLTLPKHESAKPKRINVTPKQQVEATAKSNKK